MQIIKIDNGPGSELYAGDFVRRRTRPRVVPWANDQEMSRTRFWRGIREMIPVLGQGAQFFAIVLSSDC